jgi:hypothetical protein
MPPEDDKTTELEELRATLAQRDAEMGLVLQEKAALEELVMNGPALAAMANQANNASAKREEHVEQSKQDNSQVVDPKKLAEATVAAATRTAKEVTENTIRASKEKDIAKDLYSKDPQFKLYIEEIKAVSREHPTLSVLEAFAMAKEKFPGKVEPPSRGEPKRERDAGRIRDVREPEAHGRFSGVPKLRGQDDREVVRGDAFDSAIEAGLKASGLG